MRRNKSVKGMLLLLAALTVGVVGCSSGNTKGNEPAASPSATSTESAANPSSNEELVELSLFVDHSWYPTKDWSGPIPEEITKRTGVKLNITVATDEKQLPLMIASGDLPDLVFTSNQIVRMSDPKLSLPWDDLIAQYAPDFVVDEERIKLNTANDGKIYTVLGAYSTPEEWAQYPLATDMGPGVMVRQDIMDKMGNPPLNTLEDFKNVLIRVKNEYKDQIPLVMNPAGWIRTYFSSQFGAANDGLVEKDGQLIHFLRQAELLETYKYMNSLYREGLITAENFAYKNEDQAKQLALSGKAFAYEWTTNGAETFNAQIKANGGDYSYTQIVNQLNDQAAIYKNSAGWSGTFITKNNKNPEKSIKLMQFLFSEEGDRLAKWGIEGEHWNWNEQGFPEMTYDKLNPEVQNKLGIYWWANLVGKAVNEGLFYYTPGTQTAAAEVDQAKIKVYNPYISKVKPDPDSREQVILTNIGDMLENQEAKVYLAKTEEEAVQAYNEMLKKAEDMGLADYEKWANEKYNEVKPN